MSSQMSGPVITTGAGGVAQDFVLPSAPPQADVSPLPADFPAQVTGMQAFDGSTLTDESEFIFNLTKDDIVEIIAGLDHFKALGLDGDQVTTNTFPLPKLGAKLGSLSGDLYQGRGFAVVRGIEPKNFSVADLTLVFFGVQAYIADQRGRQDSYGNMLVHIIADSSSETRKEHHRHSTNPITFHNEETGDVVGWLTRSTAAVGGKCIIASAYTIYNILAARRPDMIRTLARADWPFAFPHFQCRPVMFYHDKKLIMNFGRAPLLGSANHPRKPELPTLTARQLEALDAVETIARATELEFATKPGDMHFINNLCVLHRREGFVNGIGPTEKRHLVRMRLRSSGRGWAIPTALQHDWSDAFEQEAAARVWHIEPMPEGFFPLRQYPN